MTDRGQLMSEFVRRMRGDAPVLALATINAVRYAASGTSVILNCTVQPEGTVVNARMGCAYVGAGRGMTWPARVGQECLVAFPGGNWNHGVVIVMLPNGVDRVSAEAGDGRIVLDGNEDDAIAARVRGNVEITIDENLVMHVKGDAQEAVDGDSTTQIGGDRTATVAGNDATTVTGNRAVTVGGEDVETIGLLKQLISLLGIQLRAPITQVIGAQCHVQAGETPVLLHQLMTGLVWAAIKTHTHPGDGKTSGALTGFADASALTQILRAE